MSSAEPTYLYKLVHASSPPNDPLPEVLPLSDLDSTSGFIHLSTAAQVPGTLRHFFADQTEVYILRLLHAHVKADIRWENPQATVCGNRDDEGMFPHLYNGPKLGKREIESVRLFKRAGETWDLAQVPEAQGWLV